MLTNGQALEGIGINSTKNDFGEFKPFWLKIWIKLTFFGKIINGNDLR